MFVCDWAACPNKAAGYRWRERTQGVVLNADDARFTRHAPCVARLCWRCFDHVYAAPQCAMCSYRMADAGVDVEGFGVVCRVCLTTEMPELMRPDTVVAMIASRKTTWTRADDEAAGMPRTPAHDRGTTARWLARWRGLGGQFGQRRETACAEQAMCALLSSAAGRLSEETRPAAHSARRIVRRLGPSCESYDMRTVIEELLDLIPAEESSDDE